MLSKLFFDIVYKLCFIFDFFFVYYYIYVIECRVDMMFLWCYIKIFGDLEYYDVIFFFVGIFGGVVGVEFGDFVGVGVIVIFVV